MKHDKTIEKWFKERSEKELVFLHAVITDEGTRGILLSQAFGWAVRECEELSNMEVPAFDRGNVNDVVAKLGDLADAQMARILRYKESGICVRCKNPLLGIIREFNRKGEADVHLADYLFLSVHGRSGLCINCIGEFLLDRIREWGSHV